MFIIELLRREQIYYIVDDGKGKKIRLIGLYACILILRSL